VECSRCGSEAGNELRAGTRLLPICVTTTRAEHVTATSSVFSGDMVARSLEASLSTSEREQMLGVLSRASTRWEVHANPSVEVLDDSEPDEELGKWLSSAPAVVSIARGLSRKAPCAADGFCVQLAPIKLVGTLFEVEPCVAGFAPPKDAKEEGRARFLLWPYGYAVALPKSQAAPASVLRQRCQPTSKTGAMPYDRSVRCFLLDSKDGGRALADALKRYGTLKALGQRRDGKAADPEFFQEESSALKVNADEVTLLIPGLLAASQPKEWFAWVRRNAYAD
jgi:hypothetical protein